MACFRCAHIQTSAQLLRSGTELRQEQTEKATPYHKDKIFQPKDKVQDGASGTEKSLQPQHFVHSAQGGNAQICPLTVKNVISKQFRHQFRFSSDDKKNEKI